MKKTRMAVFCLMVAAAAGSVVRAPAQDFVATVNGVGITGDELDRNYKTYLQQRGIPPAHAGQGGQFAVLRMQTLNMLIDQELLYQEAKNKGYLADPGKVAGEIATVKARFPSPEDFAKILEERGLTEEAYEDFVGRRLSVQALVDGDIAKGISVSDEEVREFYNSNPQQFKNPEMVRARHILLKVQAGVGASQKDTAKKKIQEILKEAESGADFAELATKYSEGPSAAQGGDLGFFTRGKMVKPFEEAVFSLEPGKISGIVETRFGYHIIKVEEKKAAAVISVEEVAEEVNSFLASGKIKEAVQERVRTLREQAKIETLIEQ